MDRELIKEYEQEIGTPFTDALTGLFNHGLFRLSLHREIKRSVRYGSPFSLALIDIDNFTQYNRREGTVRGDLMLKEIAQQIMDDIRKGVDLAARYSGDVIAVLLPNIELEPALIMAERIRRRVEAHTRGSLPVSIGLVSCPLDATGEEQLIEKAFQALNVSKLRGKNRVSFLEKHDQCRPEKPPRVLVVDDDPRNVKLLEVLLRPLSYDVLKAYGGEEALSLMSRQDVDLVLLDLMMPGMDGYEVCRRIKGSEATRMVPVIFVTALDDVESKVKGIECGCDDFLTKPPNKVELIARAKSLIRLKLLNKNLTDIENVLFSLANAVEAKDIYTQGHTQRVSDLALRLGRKVGLLGHELDALRLGGVLHDIGKIGVPESILNKQGPLNEDEWQVMKAHSDSGYRICYPLNRNLGLALEAIRHHHEKIDGSGYPDGLRGEEISRVSRILGIVDIYDALTTRRPYREALDRAAALGIMRQEAASGKLDAELVEHLVEMLVKGSPRPAPSSPGEPE
jgi:putative two-component system response regulator